MKFWLIVHGAFQLDAEAAMRSTRPPPREHERFIKHGVEFDSEDLRPLGPIELAKHLLSAQRQAVAWCRNTCQQAGGRFEYFNTTDPILNPPPAKEG